MIVDEADSDISMAKDPFLEAGINLPEELPYQTIPIGMIGPRMSIESISRIPMRLRQYLSQISTVSSNIQESEEDKEDNDCERNATCLISQVHHSGATVTVIPEEEQEVLNHTEKLFEKESLLGANEIALESTNDKN